MSSNNKLNNQQHNNMDTLYMGTKQENADSSLLNAASRIISSLKKDNEKMSARLGVYDNMMNMFNTLTNGIDVMKGADSYRISKATLNAEGISSNNVEDIIHKLKIRSEILAVIEKLHPEMQPKLTSEAYQSGVPAAIPFHPTFPDHLEVNTKTPVSNVTSNKK